MIKVYFDYTIIEHNWKIIIMELHIAGYAEGSTFFVEPGRPWD